MNRGQEDDRIRNARAELSRASRLADDALAWSNSASDTYVLLMQVHRIMRAAEVSLNTVLDSLKNREKENWSKVGKELK